MLRQSYNGRGGRNHNRGGRGFPGRGHGSGRSFNNSSRMKTKTQVMKFVPNQSKGNTATYATVKEHIKQHIQKTFDKGMDVAKSIEDMKKVDLTLQKPKRQVLKKKKKKIDKLSKKDII